MPNEELIQRALESVQRLAGTSNSGEVTGYALADDLGIERSDPGADVWWALKHAKARGHLQDIHFGGGMSLEDVVIRG